MTRGAAKARLLNPKRETEAQEAFKKGGLAEQVAAIAAQHSDKKIEPWFADEARVGNKAASDTVGGGAVSIRPAFSSSVISRPTSCGSARQR